jgi:hypothetical protein
MERSEIIKILEEMFSADVEWPLSEWIGRYATRLESLTQPPTAISEGDLEKKAKDIWERHCDTIGEHIFEKEDAFITGYKTAYSDFNQLTNPE